MSTRRSEEGAGHGDGVERETVLALIRDNPGRLTKRDLARHLGLATHDKQVLRQLLRDLEAEGLIEQRGKRGYVPMGAVPPVGVVEFTGRDSEGELTGRLAGRELDETGPVVTLVEDARTRRKAGPVIGVGDRALCRLREAEEGRVEASPIKKLPRDGRKLLGVVRLGDGRPRIEPVERGSRQDFALTKAEAGNAEDGDLVVFTVAKAEQRFGLKTARITEHVGRADAPHAATVMALAAHGVPTGFSDAEEAQAAATSLASPKGREDLTQTPLLTIDPEDARDHDDAVWAAPDTDPKNTGGHVVIVAIADVAAHVPAGSPLDRGAEVRGNSVYFPDRVVPMLPERLSTDLCSLIEGEGRPCLAVRMVFAENGRKLRHTFVRGWMRSAAKLSYEDAQAAIDGQPNDKTGPLLEPVLRPLWAAYAAVKRARDARAPLEIDAPERRVRLDADGRVTSIERRARFDAHKLIEEFMIQANVCAAESLEKKRTPLLYRVHDEPAPEKLDALADFLPQVGLKWNRGEPAQPGRFNALLRKAAKGEHADIVNEVVLRSQSQAVYAPQNIGHFGLNLQRYAHFTSPIRRYADLVVHRGLIAALGLGDDGLSEADAARLETMGGRLSQAERRAMAAERDATDRYLAAFMADKVGATFQARISGVTKAGLFVRLEETGADGLAPISRLGAERYVLDAGAHALIGEESGGRYTLGQTVEVRLVEATPIQGGLLFEVTTKPTPGPRPGRRGPRPARPPAARGRRRR